MPNFTIHRAYFYEEHLSLHLLNPDPEKNPLLMVAKQHLLTMPVPADWNWGSAQIFRRKADDPQKGGVKFRIYVKYQQCEFAFSFSPTPYQPMYYTFLQCTLYVGNDLTFDQYCVAAGMTLTADEADQFVAAKELAELVESPPSPTPASVWTRLTRALSRKNSSSQSNSVEGSQRSTPSSSPSPTLPTSQPASAPISLEEGDKTKPQSERSYTPLFLSLSGVIESPRSEEDADPRLSVSAPGSKLR